VGPRFAKEVEEYLRVSGPTTFSGLSTHFARWGASDEDLRVAIDWLLKEGRLARDLDRFEKYRLR
jgi:hypothetical protein